MKKFFKMTFVAATLALTVVGSASFAETSEDFTGGGIINRQTGEMLRLKCADEECKSVNLVLISEYAIAKEKVINRIPLLEIATAETCAKQMNTYWDGDLTEDYLDSPPYAASARTISAGPYIVLLPVALVADTLVLPFTLGNFLSKPIQSRHIHRAMKALVKKGDFVTLGNDRFELVVDAVRSLPIYGDCNFNPAMPDRI